ncbi:MAG: YncE family protein [Thermoplasmata archaeon]|nr:YncE family protein [Thermoplasmata archaeon]
MLGAAILGGLSLGPPLSSSSARESLPPAHLALLGSSLPSTMEVGQYPHGIAYDTSNGGIYVANSGSGDVTVINGSTNQVWVSSIAVSGAWGIAYDSGNGDVYVAGFSPNVTVIDGSTNEVVANVSIGSAQTGYDEVAYDSLNGYLYVTDYYGGNVAVIDGTTNHVVANITVGGNPSGIAFDRGNGCLYVGNTVNITVINGSTNRVVGPGIATGGYPGEISYDPANGSIFVGSAESGANSVIVINDSSNTVVATNISLGGYPRGSAYDPTNGMMYVAAGQNVTVVNGTTDLVVTRLAAGFEPFGVAWNSANHHMYVDDVASGQVLDLNLTRSFNVSFVETGLPNGSGWSVGFGPTTWHSRSNTIVVPSVNGSFPAIITQPASGFLTDTPDPLVTVNGSAVTVPVVFSPSYLVTFTQTGIPQFGFWNLFAANNWGSIPNGTRFGGTEGTSFTFYVTNGTFEYAGLGDSASQWYSAAGEFAVNGSGTTVSVVFTPITTGHVWFNETGLPLGSTWGVFVGGSWSNSSSKSMLLQLTEGRDPFVAAGPAGYLPTPSSGCLSVPSDGYQAVLISFSLGGGARYRGQNGTGGGNGTGGPGCSSVYSVRFIESGLPAGTNWSLTLNGALRSSTGPILAFNESNGSYAYNVTPVPGFATSMSGLVAVNGGATNVSLTFTPIAYSLTFNETGLPQGTGWAVVIGSTIESSLTSSVSFQETSGTYHYVILVVQGYETNYSGSVIVRAANQSVQISFRIQTFPVVFVEFGLPAGSNWSVTVSNASTGFNETRSSTTDSITLFLPNGTYTVSFTVPTGYAGGASSTPLTVDGRGVSGPSPHFALAASRTAALVLLEWVGVLAIGAVAVLLTLVSLRRNRGTRSNGGV